MSPHIGRVVRRLSSTFLGRRRYLVARGLVVLLVVVSALLASPFTLNLLTRVSADTVACPKYFDSRKPAQREF